MCKIEKERVHAHTTMLEQSNVRTIDKIFA